ncbi:MAG: hypothetical protein FWD13_12935, partial [Treponema sp.]|nr:hypothetical protein [Treponema sp.]
PFALIFIFCFSFGACFSPWMSEAGDCTITIRFAGDDNRALVWPKDENDPLIDELKFKVKITGPTELPETTFEPGTAIGTFTVVPGFYNIYVTAIYDGIDFSRGDVIGFRAIEGQDNPVDVTMQKIENEFYSVGSVFEWNEAMAGVVTTPGGGATDPGTGTAPIEPRNIVIDITGGFEVEWGLQIADHANVIVRGRGHSLTLVTAGNIFNIYEQSVKIIDLHLEGYSDNNTSIVNIMRGTFIMQGDSSIFDNYSANSSGGGLSIYSDGTFIMEGGKIYSNYGAQGGGVGVINGGTFIMKGGVIYGNNAVSQGGGVYIQSGTFIKEGGIIYGACEDVEEEKQNIAGNSSLTAELEIGNGHAVYANGYNNTDPEAIKIVFRDSVVDEDEDLSFIRVVNGGDIFYNIEGDWDESDDNDGDDRIQLTVVVSTVTYTNKDNFITPITDDEDYFEDAEFTVTVIGIETGDEDNITLSIKDIGGLYIGDYGTYNNSNNSKTFYVSVRYNGESIFLGISAILSITIITPDNYTASDFIQPVIFIKDGGENIEGTGLDRQIPVNQGNIHYFNAYANTEAGLSKHYVLTESVELEEPDVNESNWTAIGEYTSAQNNSPFTGSFDGGGNTITGLVINISSSYQGMFAYTSGGIIKNLGLVDCDITGGSQVGGIVGIMRETSIVQNCYVTGIINGANSVGGIVGNVAASMLQNCYSTSNVFGNQNVGGIVGFYQSNTILRNCVALNLLISVTGTLPNITGRVFGSTDLPHIGVNNYAREDMDISGAGDFSYNPTGQNSTNVTIITSDKWSNPDWWQGIGEYANTNNPWLITDDASSWSSDIWDFSDLATGGFPTLLSE